jgi:hypothetical protein
MAEINAGDPKRYSAEGPRKAARSRKVRKKTLLSSFKETSCYV